MESILRHFRRRHENLQPRKRDLIRLLYVKCFSRCFVEKHLVPMELKAFGYKDII